MPVPVSSTGPQAARRASAAPAAWRGRMPAERVGIAIVGEDLVFRG
jgi:hypothetical protein